MTTRREELLSSLVDEETSEFETRRLCKSLLGDEGELARWSRYHLLRDALRGNLPIVIDLDFGAKVMAKIEDESAQIEMDHRDWRRTLLKPTAGFGLAASVAVLTVLGVQWYTAPSPVATRVAQLTTVSVPSDQNMRAVRNQPVYASELSLKRRISRNPEVAARLNSYLVNHSEYAPSHGIMPYARVVAGYETNR